MTARGGVAGPGADRSARRFPRIGLVGVVLIGVGLAESLVEALASPALMVGHDGAHGAHLLAFIGMVLVLGGVLVDARGHHRSREDSDAVR